MEDKNIKRGIDFKNRLGESKIAQSLNNAFFWWRGGKINKNSLFLIFLVFIFNLFMVYPIFSRDVTISFSSSAFLTAIADFFEHLIGFNKIHFFSLITIFSLSFAPISYYLFARRMALRHELTAFLATLLFVLPNPFFKHGLPLIGAILNGDGAHAVVFAFIPLFLLYVQSFLSTGLPAWGLISIFGTVIIAIISPFAFFNLLILFAIIATSEGFLGYLRIKILRLLFLLSSSILLSFFWYSPAVLVKIITFSHVSFSIQKFWSAFPIIIPIVPIVGALSFLVFDRREKLKPIFIGLSLFLIYFFLFTISKTLNTIGIFTADRYLVELSFSSSFLFAVIFVPLTELAARNILFKIKNNLIMFSALFSLSALFTFLTLLSLSRISIERKETAIKPIMNTYDSGIGAIKRLFDFSDVSSLLASLISFATLIFLLSIFIKYPSLIKKKK